MRLAKCLMAAAVLVAGMSAAKADTYTYTQPISGSGGDFNIFFNFTAHEFNHNLGLLTGVEFTVDGALGTTVFDSNRIPHTQAPLPLTFTAGVGIITDGFSDPQPGAFVADAGTLSGVGTDTMVQASGSILASFVIPASAFPVYYTPKNYGYLDDSLVMAATDHISGTNKVVGFDGQDYQFTGNITQTFTYDPRRHRHDVPEPGSLALLGTALAMLAGILSLV